jgi:hypothetical protein
VGLLSGISNALFGGDGADRQAQAAEEANRTNMAIYQQQRQDNQPYMQAGTQALGQMQDPKFQQSFSMADFQADPGYAFRMQEGQKALERSAAARGMTNSGATLKSLANYSQGVASDEFGNAYNRFNNDRNTQFGRLGTIAGMGQSATGQAGQAGQNYANAFGQNVTGAANAYAASQQSNQNSMMQVGGMALGAYGGAHGWW